MNKKVTEELRQEIRAFYKTKPMTMQAIADKYNLCTVTVGRILKDIPRYNKAQLYSPELKTDYFDKIDTERKAYFLGMIVTDGNVFNYNDGYIRQPMLSITLKEEDKYILETFKQELQANTAVAPDGRGCYQFAIRNKQLVDDIAKYGVVAQKTFKTYLPLIDEEFMPHLLRGIFDGDGHITAKQHENKFLHRINFCGTERLMQDIVNYLSSHFELSFIPKVRQSKPTLHEIQIANKADMFLFGEWIYKDATVFLKRKRERYEHFKEHYNLQNKTKQ